MKKKKIIISIAVVLVVCISMVVGLLLNEVFGNPVSKFLVKRSVSEHLENNYSDSDFIIEKVVYDFKNMEYCVKIVSSSDPNQHFYITADSMGQNIDDDYDLYFHKNGIYVDKYTQDTYTYDIESFITDGDIKSALLKACYAEEFYGDTQEAEQVIEVFTERITFGITEKPEACDSIFYIEDTKSWDPSAETKEESFGITLTDTWNNESQTIAIVNVNYSEEWYTGNVVEARVIGTQKDSVLIQVYVASLNSYSFIYNAETNELIELEPDGEWYIDDNILIGKSIAMAVDQRVDLLAYNWSGELLYSEDKVLASSCVLEDFLYFIEMNEGETHTDFKVYKMKLDGTEKKEHYSVTLPRGSYIAILNDNKISMWDCGTEKETTIDLFTLKTINQN